MACSQIQVLANLNDSRVPPFHGTFPKSSQNSSFLTIIRFFKISHKCSSLHGTRSPPNLTVLSQSSKIWFGVIQYIHGCSVEEAIHCSYLRVEWSEFQMTSWQRKLVWCPGSCMEARLIGAYWVTSLMAFVPMFCLKTADLSFHFFYFNQLRNFDALFYLLMDNHFFSLHLTPLFIFLIRYHQYGIQDRKSFEVHISSQEGCTGLSLVGESMFRLSMLLIASFFVESISAIDSY